MAFVPSKKDTSDGLLRATFLSRNGSHLVAPKSTCARTDGGVYFGQKAALTPSSHKAVLKASGEKKTEWTAPSSVSAFSDLTPGGSRGLSSLRSIATTSSRSCDSDVETDLARVHPNSATTQHDRCQNLFASNGVIRYSSLKSPNTSNDKVPNKQNQGNATAAFRSVFELGRNQSGSQSLSLLRDRQVNSSSTPAFGKPNCRYDLSKIPTLSPTSPYPHTTDSLLFPSLSYPDLVDTEVKCTDLSKGKTFFGVVENVSLSNIATVIKHSGDETRVHCSQLKLISPVVNEKVKVVRSTMGNSRLLGKTGTLLSTTIAGDRGVVRFFSLSGDAFRNLAEVKLSHLAKFVKATKPKASSAKASSSVMSSSSSIWESVVLNNGASFPFAPFPTQPTSVSLPTNFPIVPSSNLSLYDHSSLSSSMSTPSNDNSVSSPAFTPLSVTTNGAVKYPSTFPLSYQFPPTTSAKNGFSFNQLVSRGGGSRDDNHTSRDDNHTAKRKHSSSGNQSVADIIDRLLSNQRKYHAHKDDDSNVDVKASRVRVSLICPISQKRLSYPSRGNCCKHLQCFDAEAYILMNLHHKPKARVKQHNGRSLIQPLPNKRWYCPICIKHVLESQLYIDRSLMKVLSSVEDSVMEVELSEGGTWRPCKKVVVDVIDLTADDD